MSDNTTHSSGVSKLTRVYPKVSGLMPGARTANGTALSY